MSPRVRAALDAALLALLVAAAALMPTGPSPVRTVVTIAAVCFVPGGAILTRLPVGDPLAWAGLAFAFSLGVVAAVSFAMLWLGWHPAVPGTLLAAGSAALLLVDLSAMRKRPAEVATP